MESSDVIQELRGSLVSGSGIGSLMRLQLEEHLSWGIESFLCSCCMKKEANPRIAWGSTAVNNKTVALFCSTMVSIHLTIPLSLEPGFDSIFSSWVWHSTEPDPGRQLWGLNWQSSLSTTYNLDWILNSQLQSKVAQAFKEGCSAFILSLPHCLSLWD